MRVQFEGGEQVPFGGFKIIIEVPQPAQRILRCGVFRVERHSALRGRDADIVQVNTEAAAKLRERAPGVGILRREAGGIETWIYKGEMLPALQLKPDAALGRLG